MRIEENERKIEEIHELENKLLQVFEQCQELLKRIGKQEEVKEEEMGKFSKEIYEIERGFKRSVLEIQEYLPFYGVNESSRTKEISRVYSSYINELKGRLERI
jgi:hypothetical protein